MKTSLAVSFMTLLITTACGSNTRTAGSALLARADQWEPVVACRNAGAILEVDGGERRNLRVVIKDEKAATQLGLPLGTKLFEIFGRSPQGVFDPSGFQSFVGALEGSSVLATARVSRKNDGLEVLIVDRPHVICKYPNWGASGSVSVKYYLDRIGGAFCPSLEGNGNPGLLVRRLDEQKLADWYFGSCL